MVVENSAKKTGKRGKHLFLLINALVIAGILLQEFATEKDHLSLTELTVRPVFLAGGLFCFLAAVFSEYQKYRLLLKACGDDRPSRCAFGCAVWGKYYDNITPMGAGGQPFQMYYLKKHGYSAGVSGAVPIVGFLGLQFAFILLALLVFAFSRLRMESMSLIRLSAYIGILCYAFVPLCILLFSAAQKPLEQLVKSCSGLLQKLRILKDGESAKEKALGALRAYCESLQMFRETPMLYVWVLLLSLLFRIAVLSMPYFVLRSFGIQTSYFHVFCEVVYIYAAISLIPTPGNAGAAEASFYMVFSTLTGPLMFWAVMLWRLWSYYSWLLLGFVYQLLPVPTKKAPAKEKTNCFAQFVDVYFPSIDGVVHTVDAYAKRLQSQGSCTVVCPRAAGRHKDDHEYEVLRVPAIFIPGLSYRLPLPFLSVKLRRFLKEAPLDVIHVHSPFSLGRYAMRRAKQLGIPVVASFHSKYYDDVMNITHCPVLARCITRSIVRFYERADQVWACSASTAETLRSYGYRGDITVMDNGVDMDNRMCSTYQKELAAEELHLPKDKKILLFVGQQIWQKNLALVLDTCAALKKKGHDFLMLIAGSGYNQKEIMDYARTLGLNDCVQFTGQIKDRQLLMGLYLASDLFFFPSQYDNAPLVLREAALMGLPALLLRDSNAAECVIDGVNGFTEENDCIKMADKICRIFQDYDLAQIGEAAQSSIPINWDDILVRVEAKYRALRLPEASQCR